MLVSAVKRPSACDVSAIWTCHALCTRPRQRHFQVHVSG
jgi:hypothetical protein